MARTKLPMRKLREILQNYFTVAHRRPCAMAWRAASPHGAQRRADDAPGGNRSPHEQQCRPSSGHAPSLAMRRLTGPRAGTCGSIASTRH